MKAIRVKYIPPTYHLPAHYKAWEQDGANITLSKWAMADGVDRDLLKREGSNETLATYAAYRLAESLNWTGSLVGGTLGPGQWAFVFVNSTNGWKRCYPIPKPLT